MWPELFTIPLVGISVKSFGAMIALGFLVGLWTAGRRAERMGLRPEVVSDLAVWLIVAGVLGSRLFYVVQYWEHFRDRPLSALAVWDGGMVFYGGFLAAVAAGFWFVHRRNLSPWDLGDCVAPSVILAYAFGRIGCFLNGCCWGFAVPEGSPLGVAFPAEGPEGAVHPLFREQLERGLVLRGDAHAHPVFPAQLLSAGLAVVLFVVLDRKLARRRYPGQVFFWMLMGYSVYRFGVEFVRDDTPLLGASGAFPGLTIAQWISPFVFLGALAWARYVAHRPR